MSLVSPPPIRVKPRDPKRLEQCLQLQKDGILASPKDVGQHVSTVMIDRVPSPVWLRFLPHVTPHFIELRGQSATLGELVRAADLNLHLLWRQGLQHRLIHLVELRRLFLSSFITVVGLTCNTRPVSRMPLALRAISTIWRLTSGNCPA